MSKKNRQMNTTNAPEDQEQEVQMVEQAQEGQEVAEQQVEQEVVQEVHTTAAPEQAPVNKEEKKSTDGVQLSVFETRVQWIREEGTVHEKHVLTVLEQYVAVCAHSVDLNAIAVEQQRLWRLFEYIHNQPTEFRKLFNIVVEFAKKYKEEAFNLAKFFRAQSSLTLAADRMAAFNNIRTLILNTAESKDRSRVKAIIDIRKIIEVDCIPEHVRAQYIAYYN